MLHPVKSYSAVLIDDMSKSKKPIKEKGSAPSDTNQKGIEVSIGKHLPDNATYSKPCISTNIKNEIGLQKKILDFFEPLRMFVDKLISMQDKLLKEESQKYSEKNCPPKTLDPVHIISDDGELGVDKTANRIVAFAKAISGEDKSKISHLKLAIDLSFNEAKEIMGELPEISQKTHDEVFKRLEYWENS